MYIGYTYSVGYSWIIQGYEPQRKKKVSKWRACVKLGTYWKANECQRQHQQQPTGDMPNQIVLARTPRTLPFCEFQIYLRLVLIQHVFPIEKKMHGAHSSCLDLLRSSTKEKPNMKKEKQTPRTFENVDWFLPVHKAYKDEATWTVSLKNLISVLLPEPSIFNSNDYEKTPIPFSLYCLSLYIKFLAHLLLWNRLFIHFVLFIVPAYAAFIFSLFNFFYSVFYFSCVVSEWIAEWKTGFFKQ